MIHARALWRVGLLNLLSQALFLVLLYIAGRDTPTTAAGWLQLPAQLAIVAVPAALWIVFFYLRDRVEPEPIPYVVAAVFVGMALASLAGLPVEHRLANVDAWLYTSRLTLALGSVFIVGTLHGALFYLGVRYGFYPLREFDEPVDGVVYGAFIGAAYAAVLSLAALANHPDTTLFAAGYTASTNVMVYASVASLVGFFVGKAKYSRGRPQTYFLTGLLLAIALVGLYTYLTDFVLVSGVASGFALSFGLTLLLAAVILTIVILEMRRLTSRPVPQVARTARVGPDWLVLGVIVILFAAGARIRADALRGIEFRSTRHGVSLLYPRTFVHAGSLRFIRLLDDNVLAVEDLTSPGTIKNQYALTVRSGETALDTIAFGDFVLGGVEPSSVVAKEGTSVGGVPGLRLKYAYLHKVDGRWDPELVLVYTDVVPRRDRTFVFSYQAGRQGFQAGLPAYEKMLRSVRWETTGGAR